MGYGRIPYGKQKRMGDRKMIHIFHKWIKWEFIKQLHTWKYHSDMQLGRAPEKIEELMGRMCQKCNIRQYKRVLVRK